ncbi:CHAD domain-containing protein [Limisalsivibrio acetivorans]|uniref:CHAD domain-containing protein n=1 Tax=Limisalsivibrio acetivorans TaxID=1304888 RepID=UPI0003B57F01|nr:CHAD domain-containing protein [Limisalsivibrio acetivorans]
MRNITKRIERIDFESLKEALTPYELSVSETEERECILIDAFDWLLARAGLTLIYSPRLLELHGDGIFEENRVSKIPLSCSDLPDSPLADIVCPVIDPRVLLEKLSYTEKQYCASVLDDEGKTVARYLFKTMKSTDAQLDTVSLQELRGYSAEFKKADKALKRLGFGDIIEDEFSTFITLSGLDPRAYSTKVSAPDEPEMPAEDAVKSFLLDLLEIIEMNEEGTKLGLDIEFLHDFRVSVRRTRSALAMLKGVFPEGITNRFRADFKDVQKVTNQPRDLDVYAHMMQEYRELLPLSMENGLEPLEKMLEQTRKREQKSLAEYLESSEYHKIKEDWRSFLTGGMDAERTEKGAMPVRELAAEGIAKAYGKVIKKGGKLSEDSPADDYHKIRIDCKKLRYLLEFFGVLYPGKDSSKFISELKKLQDSLGSHQDYEVQQEELYTFVEEVKQKVDDPAPVSMAAGYLIKILSEKQMEERMKGLGLVKRFIREKMQNKVEEMLKK